MSKPSVSTVTGAANAKLKQFFSSIPAGCPSKTTERDYIPFVLNHIGHRNHDEKLRSLTFRGNWPHRHSPMAIFTIQLQKVINYSILAQLMLDEKQTTVIRGSALYLSEKRASCGDQWTTDRNDGWMIEFRGTYSPKSDGKAMMVLVQFDGVLLHVWHQSDPFYRILSCDAFQVASSLMKGQRCVKLSNGDRIWTDDLHATDSLSQSDANDRKSAGSLSKSTWIVATLTTISALFAIWWFVKNGFPL